MARSSLGGTLVLVLLVDWVSAQDTCELCQQGTTCSAPLRPVYTVRLGRLDRDDGASDFMRQVEARYVDEPAGVGHMPEDGACRPTSDHGERLCSREFIGAELEGDDGTDFELQWHASGSATSPRVCGEAGAWVIQTIRAPEENSQHDVSIRRHLRAWACGTETEGPAGLTYSGLRGRRSRRPLFWNLCSAVMADAGLTVVQNDRVAECAVWVPFGELNIVSPTVASVGRSHTQDIEFIAQPSVSFVTALV